MRIVILAAAMLLLAGGRSFARDEADFTGADLFRFNMQLADADAVLQDAKRWEVAYRIDTPSTNEIACRLDQTVMYLLRFYEGRCYHFEKRADIPEDQVDPLFSFYKQQYGETPEATKSSDDNLFYAHWMLKDRDIEITAYTRNNGTYAVIYQEFDPKTEGEALRVQESEVQQAPTEVDPITGQPRPIKHSEQQQQGGEQQGQGGEQNGQQQAGKGDGKGDNKGEGDNPPPDGGGDDDEPGEDW
jgi:hypothetical protein